MPSFKLGTTYDVKITISPAGIISFLIIIPILGLIAANLRGLTSSQALLAGGLSALIWFVSEWIHQMGHAFAARRVGYPMQRIHYFSLLALGLYPQDEPSLPRHIHVKRALGGFWVNLLFGLLLTPAALLLWPGGGIGGWLAGFSAFLNAIILGLGAFLPIDTKLGATDGGTLLRLWRESRRQ